MFYKPTRTPTDRQPLLSRPQTPAGYRAAYPGATTNAQSNSRPQTPLRGNTKPATANYSLFPKIPTNPRKAPLAPKIVHHTGKPQSYYNRGPYGQTNYSYSSSAKTSAFSGSAPASQQSSKDKKRQKEVEKERKRQEKTLKNVRKREEKEQAKMVKEGKIPSKSRIIGREVGYGISRTVHGAGVAVHAAFQGS
ncbi:uncharacterized protein BDV14DRAFT_200496 [Aspergillus stella-maris]|uniref:uncharacterized protein n=1 Tax=Aspergillus stella-maris TaxID=1810926 RepID=UPI003CCE2256